MFGSNISAGGEAEKGRKKFSPPLADFIQSEKGESKGKVPTPRRPELLFPLRAIYLINKWNLYLRRSFCGSFLRRASLFMAALARLVPELKSFTCVSRCPLVNKKMGYKVPERSWQSFLFALTNRHSACPQTVVWSCTTFALQVAQAKKFSFPLVPFFPFIYVVNCAKRLALEGPRTFHAVHPKVVVSHSKCLRFGNC
jgi:hypothetical protein